MYNISEEMKHIKPKYLDNDMLVYFDDRRLIFSPEPGFTVVKQISFSGADKNLIKFSDIDDIEKSTTNLSNDVKDIYNIQIPDTLITLNLNKDIMSLYNAVASCGKSIVSGVALDCIDSELHAYGYSIDFVAAYIKANYNTCNINVSIRSGFNLAYYLYTLDKLYGTKDGLSVGIKRIGKTSWIRCQDIILVISDIHHYLSYSGLITIFDWQNLRDAPVHNKKDLVIEYGTRLKHLGKCLDDSVNVLPIKKATAFGSGDAVVIIGDKSNGRRN